MSELITATSYGPSAGSARVRVFEWVQHLRLDSYAETYIDSASNSPRVLAGRLFDVLRAERRLHRLEHRARSSPLLISRQASPLGRGHVESKLLRSAARGVYDFDDAIYLRRGGVAGALFPKASIWRKSVEAADVVIAGNDILASESEKLNASTIVIPSCVEPSDYAQKTSYELAEFPTAVWIGSPSTEKYLKEIEAPLLRAHAQHSLRLVVVSAGGASLGQLDRMIERVQWRRDSVGVILGEADFGIMPLTDDPWSRGKCAYKLLQYGAAGLPLVASPVGANMDVLRQGEGLAPTTGDDWSESISQIVCETAAARKKRGNAARNTVEEHYSFGAWEDKWLDALGLKRR